MKISALSFNTFKSNHNNLKNNKINSNVELSEKQKMAMPTSAQMLAFLGGYTLNLNQTFDKLENDQYPPDIQEMALEEIDNKDKTLYDVHFSKYKGVLDCLTLEELIERYPEFKNVESAYDVKAKEDSFIGKFQSDDLDLFPNYNDLSLQLIKLYWGQGFSLNDLSKYIEENSEDKKGINLYYAMNKLNIPLMNQHYAQVLKLSNKEYNKTFTQEMSRRLREAREFKEQKANGEAVLIPRGKLTPEHKQRISEGLRKHYSQHPEKLFEMSEVQKRFYEEHPEKKKELSEVMSRAWNEISEGRSVLKYINKFMKKNNVEISPQELVPGQNIGTNKQKLLMEFWQKNEWAKEKLSIAIKKSWEKQQEKNRDLEEIQKIRTIPGVQMVVSLMPSKVEEKIKAWAKKQNADTENIVFSKAIISSKDGIGSINRDNKYVKRSQAIIDKFFVENPNEADLVTTSLHGALLDLECALKENKKALPRALRNNPAHIEIMKYAYNLACFKAGIPTMETFTNRNLNLQVSIKQIYKVYNDIAYQAVALGYFDFGEYMENCLNYCYSEYSKLPRFQ